MAETKQNRLNLLGQRLKTRSDKRRDQYAHRNHQYLVELVDEINSEIARVHVDADFVSAELIASRTIKRSLSLQELTESYRINYRVHSSEKKQNIVLITENLEAVVDSIVEERCAEEHQQGVKKAFRKALQIEIRDSILQVIRPPQRSVLDMELNALHKEDGLLEDPEPVYNEDSSSD